MRKAFYDFSVSPYSYDFVQFLAAARGMGCEHVVFVPGNRAYQKCSPYEQRFRMRNLLKPLAKLAGGYTVCESRLEASQMGDATWPLGYTVDKPVHGHMLGQVLRLGRARFLKASPEATKAVKTFLAGRRPVTITIREQAIKAPRNSNIPAWIEVAGWLKDRGLDPLFVPDTAHPDRDFGFDSYKPASQDVDLRLALYEQASLNLGVNNGPMALCSFSKNPYRIFKMQTEACPETSAAFLKANSFPVGAQFPWKTADQRVIWEDDTAENIIGALAHLEERIAA